MTSKATFVMGCLVAVAATVGARIAIGQVWEIQRGTGTTVAVPGTTERAAVARTEARFSGSDRRPALGVSGTAAVVLAAAVLLAPPKARRWFAFAAAAAALASFVMAVTPLPPRGSGGAASGGRAGARLLTAGLSLAALVGLAVAIRHSGAPRLAMPEGPPSEHETEDTGVWE